MKRKIELGLISKEQRTSILGEIVTFFQDERGEKIGIVAAGEVLDFVLEKIGQEIYNKGIKDARNLIRSRMEDFDVDLEALIIQK